MARRGLHQAQLTTELLVSEINSSPAYPWYREVDVVLRDGITVHVRPIRAEDAPALAEFFRTLSLESRLLRFFSAAVDTTREAVEEAGVDYQRSDGLLAMAGPSGRIVAHALYVASGPTTAEVAFAVDDPYQGRGLGTLLLGQLAETAAANGITSFEALVMPANQRMLQMLRDSGFDITVKRAGDVLHVQFATLLSERVLEQFDRREGSSAASAVAAVLYPRSVAVIGASHQPGTVGAEVFRNLMRTEFTGPVYPVNLSASVIQCVPAYASVEQIAGPVDLAVVAVPATHVVTVARECARKGVRAVVVLSAGFGEVGAEGRARQSELRAVCRDSGMRLVGPNSIGVVNTDPRVRLNASFGPQRVTPGRLGLASQSGALGMAAIDYAASRGLGLSSFVSMGNKADLSSNDLLEYWETDPRTDVVLLYLESFGNPRKFSRIARRLGRRKPIVVVKSGRSAAGSRATSSHTGALLAMSDVTVDALFQQAGVIRVDSMESLFDVAALLAHQPLPYGPRVAIVTNVGGPAIMCADACEANGLEVPVLDEATQARLRRQLPAEASVTNPVDMIAGASAANYRESISIVAADPNVDAVISIFIPGLFTREADIARALVQAAEREADTPMLTVFVAASGPPIELRSGSRTIPSYAFPELAARALALVTRYAEWRARPMAPVARPSGLDAAAAARLIDGALESDSDWLDPGAVQQLFGFYGLPLVEQRLSDSPEHAALAARALGGPVALKAVVPGLVHKTDAGAVKLNLRDTAVQEAALSMRERLPVSGYLVQRMAPEGVEMLAGVVHDPQFGPVLACGTGGVEVELLKDVAVRLTPLTAEDASAMLRELRTFPLLNGYRGAPVADVPRFEDLLLRLSTLADDLPDVAEVDCNPVVVSQTGAVIVDARVRVARTVPLRPLGAHD
jgi:acetyl coenzyme A synthetase (ADP forming)-like protein